MMQEELNIAGDGADSDTDSYKENASKFCDDKSRKAPTGLLMEFIHCLMEKDYVTARKLCKMVLLYEPENEEALEFQPLIEEKLKLQEENEVEDIDEKASGSDAGTSSSDDDDDSSVSPATASQDDEDDSEDASSDGESNNTEDNIIDNNIDDNTDASVKTKEE